MKTYRYASYRHLTATAMPLFNSSKHNNSLGNTVVVTTTTTTTTTRSNSQGEQRKPSILSKLKSNNSNTQVTRQTHSVPASTASSPSSSTSRFGRKNKDIALNNGIGARSNNPTYTDSSASKPGMGTRLRAKWSSSGSEKTGAWRNF